MMANRKRVAVIGAGQAGLCAIKQLAEHPQNFDIVAFEKALDIGSHWSGNVKQETKNGHPVIRNISDDFTMYLPRELLEIPGFPHKKGHSYVDGVQISQYLQDYAEVFELRKYIKFHTLVTKVTPMPSSAEHNWEVTFCDVEDQRKTCKCMFDSIIVSVSHTDKPSLPDIKGMDLFTGIIMHSQAYRKKSVFKNKRVVILGASYSGLNLAFQISHAASKIFIANDKGRLKTEIPSNVEERCGILQMTKNSVIFEDDTEEKVDILILCTGYAYNLPFLDNIITVNNEQVTPIYKHIIHIEYPTLMFIGLPKDMAYFPQNHEVARFIVRMLLGSVKILSKRVMYDEEESERANRLKLGYGLNQSHYLGSDDLQWRFNEDIAQIGGFKPLPSLLKKIWDVAVNKLQTDFGHFHEYNYTVTGSNTFLCEHTVETTYL